MVMSIEDIRAREQLQTMVDLRKQSLPVKPEFDTPAFVKQEEGFRGDIFNDTEGVPTIGFGFNLNEQSIKDKIPEDVLSGQRELTEAEAEPLFQERLQIATEDAIDFVGEGLFNDMSEQQRAALISISFNLGKDRLSGFEKMQKALQAGDFETAVEELFDSKRAKQLPNRTKREANLLKGQQP